MIRVGIAFTRMTCLIIWVLVMYATRLACMPIGIFSKTADAQARRAVLRLFSKGVLVILGMRVDVHGRPPAMPYLLVSNHLAAVDRAHRAIREHLDLRDGLDVLPNVRDVREFPVHGIHGGGDLSGERNSGHRVLLLRAVIYYKCRR